MLLATCSASGLLQVLRMNVDWTPPPDQLTSSTLIEPLITATPLAITSLAVCTGRSAEYVQHLLILPPTKPPLSDDTRCGDIIAVISQRDGTSSIQAFTLQETLDGFHPAFSSITIGNDKSAKQKSSWKLQPHVHTPLPSACVSVRPLRCMTAIAYCLQDGRVEIRDRVSQELLQTDSIKTDITCLSDAGLAFLAGDEQYNVALSPNACASVELTSVVLTDHLQDVLRVRVPENVGGAVTRHDVALALLFANVTLSSVPAPVLALDQTHDDIMTLIEHHRATINETDSAIDSIELLNEIHVATLSADTLSLHDPQRFWALPGVLRCLSVQYQLFRGNDETQASARTAWLMMEVRHAGHVLPKSMETAQRNQSARTEVLSLFLSLCSWYARLATYLAQEVLMASSVSREVGNDQIFAKVRKSPGLRFLLSFWGRSCLTLIHSAIYKLARLRQEILKQHRGISPTEYHKWQEIGVRLRDGPVEVQPFSAFIQDVDGVVKKCLESNETSDEERMVMERDIIITGTLPETWSEVLDGIFEHALPKLLQAANDGTRIFTARDYWQDSKEERVINGSTRRAQAFDVIRKTPLTDDGGPLRQCVRCKSLTDVVPTHRPDCQSLGNLVKSCICGGAWALLK